MHTALGKKRLDQAHWCSRAVPASQISYAELEYSSVVGCLPNICKALGFIPALPKLKNKHSPAWTRSSDWFSCFKAIVPYLTRYLITTELKWRSYHSLSLNMGLRCTGIRKGFSILFPPSPSSGELYGSCSLCLLDSSYVPIYSEICDVLEEGPGPFLFLHMVMNGAVSLRFTDYNYDNFTWQPILFLLFYLVVMFINI